MDIIIMPNAEAASKAAAQHIANQIKNGNIRVLGLATGGTPVPMYKELIRLHKEEGLDFSGVSSFNLDEYAGLPPTHPCSYRYFMNDNLFDHINIDKANTRVPNGMAEDIPAECEAYEEAIEEAGFVDLQVLGIGTDGHIGFNEPGSSLASRTRYMALTEQTRDDNTRFFNSKDEVPTHCVTMGIGTILDAGEVVLLAFGENKADAIAATVEGPVSAFCPASALQLHENVRIYVDEAAASKLKLKDYYRFAWDNRPSWQD